jgi:hypothetical protein
MPSPILKDKQITFADFIVDFVKKIPISKEIRKFS